MDVQHQFFSLAQIAPPHHSISPAALPATISPAAISIKSDPPVITVDDVDMDSDSDPSSGSDMDDDEDDDDEDVDDSYKERSRGKRSGPPGSKSQRGSGAGSAQRRASKGDGQSSGTVSILSTNGKKSTGKAGASSDAGSAGATSAPKKRGNGRITVAEFVPPDVTGLSKREARLVKNRAAAFLSRQRKREEFETMEARLAEALQENARLKAQKGQTNSPSPAPQDDAEVQRLRALLREAEQRERALRTEVEQTRQQQVQQPSQPSPQIVKTEEPEFFLRMPGGLDIGPPEPMVQDRRVFSTKEKERHGGPGLSLMILVFSLTLLSLPHGQQLQGRLNDGQSAPTRISFAPSGSSAAPFPVLSNLIEKWEGGMDIIDGIEGEGSDNEMEVELEAGDQDDNGDGASDQDKQTYTVDFEMPVLADDTQTDEDGKIRVRIQPCGAPRPRRAPRVPQAQVTTVDGLTPFTVPPFTADNMFDPSVYAADAENWAGWTEFLNEEVFSADSQANAHLVPADVSAAALSPMSEPEATVFIGSDTASERYLTPPPFDHETPGNLSPSPETEPTTGPTTDDNKESLDVDVPLSQLPAWSRALVRAVAGEKVRAKIRMSRGPKWGAEKTAKLKARAGSKSKVGFTHRV